MLAKEVPALAQDDLRHLASKEVPALREASGIQPLNGGSSLSDSEDERS